MILVSQSKFAIIFDLNVKEVIGKKWLLCLIDTRTPTRQCKYFCVYYCNENQLATTPMVYFG